MERLVRMRPCKFHSHGERNHGSQADGTQFDAVWPRTRLQVEIIIRESSRETLYI